MSSNPKNRESPVVTARASVLLFDADRHSWVPSGDVQSLSWIQLLQQKDKECFRIVGWRQPDNQIVVNSLLKAGMEYQSHGNFQEWRDPISQSVYGLHFPEVDEADLFFKTVHMVLAKLATHGSSISVGRLQAEDGTRNRGGNPGDRTSRQSGSNTSLPVGEYAVPAKPPEPAGGKQLQSLCPATTDPDLTCPPDQVDCTAASNPAGLSTTGGSLHYRQPSTASSASLGYATGGSSHQGSVVVAPNATSATAGSAAAVFSSASSSSGSPSTASSYGYGYGGRGSVNGTGGGSGYASASASLDKPSGGLMMAVPPCPRQGSLDNSCWSDSLAPPVVSQDRLQPTSINQRPASPKLLLQTSQITDKEVTSDFHASSRFPNADDEVQGVSEAAGPPPIPLPPVLPSMRNTSVPAGSTGSQQAALGTTESLEGSVVSTTMEKSSNGYPSVAASSIPPPPPLLLATMANKRKQSGNKGDAGGSSPTPTPLTTTVTSPVTSTQRSAGNTGSAASLSSMMMREMQRRIEARRRLVDAAEAGEGTGLGNDASSTLPRPGPGGAAKAPASNGPETANNPRNSGVLAQVASGSQRTFAPTPSTESMTSHSLGLSSASGIAAPITKSDLETLRREIVGELRRELSSAKNEILDCIRLRKSS